MESSTITPVTVIRGRQANYRPRLLLLALPLALLGCFSGGSDDQQSERTATVRGEISIEPATAVDGTVNNPDADRTPNDSEEQAQPLTNPAIVGGYAGAEGTGSTGKGPDPNDYYEVELLEDDVVRLFVAGDDADLQLNLLGDSEEVAAWSVASGGEIAQLVAPENGEYLLRIHADRGASNYVLLVGEPAALLDDRTDRMGISGDDDFVPGELIVHFDDAQGSGPPTLRRNTVAQRAREWGMEMRSGTPGNGVLMRTDEATSPGAPAGPAAAGGDVGSRLPERARRQLETVSRMQALRREPDVRHVELNRVVRAHASPPPDDDRFGEQWNLPAIGMEAAWSQTTGSEDVVVAIIDTGVIADHEDLDGKVVETADFTSDCDDEPEDATSFHGTEVAGIAAASTDNDTGIAGVGWNTRLMSVRALCPDGTGTTQSVRDSVRYAAGLHEDSEQAADIINLSLGGAGFSEADAALYEEIADAGIVVVAAAGNDGTTRRIYPAAYETVFSVGATNKDGERASYSNTGLMLDLAAPGGDGAEDEGILTTTGPGDDYDHRQGTSMAAPHLAGVLALMRAEFSDLSYDHVPHWLDTGDLTQPPDDEPWTPETGFGLLDADAAVTRAAGTPPSGLLRAGPRTLSFTALDDDDATLDSTLELETVDGTTPSGVTARADAAWLDVEEIRAPGSSEPGEYRVVADPTGMGTGTYYGRVNVETDQGVVLRVRAKLEVVDVVPTGEEDAGLHYVQLIDADSGATVAEKKVRADNGRYAYRFRDVPPGQYVVIAGTDNDNDGKICGPGEACGAWPALAGEAFTVGPGQTVTRDFTTGYRGGLADAIDVDAASRRHGTGSDRNLFRRQE